MGYLAALLAGVMLFALPAGAAETRIGAATAVIPDTSGTLITGVAVTVLDGSDVFKQQRVLTEAQGRAQLAFLDGSALTVGPNSDVTLDEFVFDPDAGRGSARVVAAKGVLRYVGGKISKTTDVAITTPSATIGIRGGIVVVDIDAGGRTNAYFLYGERMSMTANGITQVAQRPGSVISLTPGQPPAPARLASFGEMRQALNGLQASPNRQPIGPVQPAPTGQSGQAGQVGQGQTGQQQAQPVLQGQQSQQQPVQQGQSGQQQPAPQGQSTPRQPGQSTLPAQQQAAAGAPADGMQPQERSRMSDQPAASGRFSPQDQGRNQAAGQGSPAGQPAGPVDRSAMAVRFDNGLSRIGGVNSTIGPANVGPPNIGNFGRPVGPANRGPNGPGGAGGPGFGPRPLPIDGIPRAVQQLPGMLPSPGGVPPIGVSAPSP
jgi:hypothetical protein